MLYCYIFICFFFFFKQKTAYEMRISDWSSDVCSSDLMTHNHPTSAEGLTPAYLNGLLAETLPEARVETVNVIDAKTYGEQMVSTAGRVIIDVTYAAGSPPNLPRNLEIGRASCRERVCQYV